MSEDMKMAPAQGWEAGATGTYRSNTDSIQSVLGLGWKVIPCHSITDSGSCTCGDTGCRAAGKHPRIRDWINGATSDIDTINQWLEQWPNAVNLGVVPTTGVVVDIDPRNGGTLDAVSDLPETPLVVATGGGGWHLYYDAPREWVATSEGKAQQVVRSVTKRTNWRPGIDIQATNGYVLMAGSRHVSGRAYTWHRFDRDQSVPEFPTGKLDDKASTPHGSLPKTGDALLNGIPEGQRDNELFRLCCRWRRQLGDDRAAVETLALKAAESCTPPFPRVEALAKVEQAFKMDHSDADHQYSPTDDGNASLFVDQHHDVIRYATDAEIWMAWDGSRWAPKAYTRVLALARETARSLGERAVTIQGDEARKAALKHATMSLSAGRIKAMPALGLADPKIGVKLNEFDVDAWTLNTPSGTVELTTGAQREHRRDDLLSKITQTAYDPSASAPGWEAWLSWAMCDRPELVEFLQRAVGYTITGDTGEQVLFLLHGGGANGKSTFLSVMEGVLGDYALHAEPDLLTTKRGGASTTGVADLHGKRFVVASETREGARLDERTVKQLTGEDAITARRLYQDFFTFVPTHKIWFAVNHRPTITDDSHAMWRRVLLVPWDARVEPQDQRRGLADSFIEKEGPGILKWMVEGALKWQQDGLQVPDVVRAKTNSYRSEQDDMGQFIEERLKSTTGAFLDVASLYADYRVWVGDGGRPMGKTTFLNRMDGRLGERVRERLGDGTRPWGYRDWSLTLGHDWRP